MGSNLRPWYELLGQETAVLEEKFYLQATFELETFMHITTTMLFSSTELYKSRRNKKVSPHVQLHTGLVIRQGVHEVLFPFGVVRRVSQVVY